MIYTISLIVTIISYLLFKRAAGSMSVRELNPLSIAFYYYLFAVSFIGATFIAAGYGDNPVLFHVGERGRILGWLVVCYVMIAFPIGAILGTKLIIRGSVSKRLTKFITLKLQKDRNNRTSFKLVLKLLTLLSFASAVYMVANTGSVPQFSYFRAETQLDLLLTRTAINRDFQGTIYIKTIIFETLTPILSLISFSYYLATRSKSDALWFLAMFLLAFFSATFSLTKSTLVIYLFSLFLTYLYAGKALSMKAIMTSGFFLGALLVVFFFITMPDAEPSKIASEIAERVIFNQISGTFFALEHFPSSIPHIGFNSLSHFISSLFYEDHVQPSTRLVAEYTFPIATAQGAMNLMSTLFVGEAWANFGAVGLFISPIYVGFLIGLFYSIILTLNKSPFTVALLSYNSIGVNIGSQFNQYLFNTPLWGAFAILAFSYFFSEIIKSAAKRRMQSHEPPVATEIERTT